MTKKIVLPILILILLVVIALFALGSSILTQSILGVPFGNIIVWIGFIAMQLIAYFGCKGFKKSTSIIGKTLRLVMIALISMSILWFAIAYVLSGNLSFNFSNTASGYVGSPDASVLYWNIIYTLIIAPIILMIAYSLLRFFERLNER